MYILIRTLIFLLLTVATQVGGLIYLVSLSILSRFDLNSLSPWKRRGVRFGLHVSFYILMTFLVIPPLASIFGRVSLPAFQEGHLKPRNFLTAVLNRRYVRPELREAIIDASNQMGEKYEGFVLNYLDANFPFRMGFGPFRKRGFPLLPHLSHSDGEKLDIGLVYRDAATGELSGTTPSAIGYGISEEPLPGEYDRPSECSSYPMYSFMKRIWPQGSKKYYAFEPVVTRELVQAFVNDKRIGKILFEPHLKKRLKLSSGKVKPVQCGSVRHDDHVHVQLR